MRSFRSFFPLCKGMNYLPVESAGRSCSALRHWVKSACAAQFRLEVLSQRLRGRFYSRTRCRHAFLDEPFFDRFGIAEPSLLVYLRNENWNHMFAEGEAVCCWGAVWNAAFWHNRRATMPQLPGLCMTVWDVWTMCWEFFLFRVCPFPQRGKWDQWGWILQALETQTNASRTWAASPVPMLCTSKRTWPFKLSLSRGCAGSRGDCLRLPFHFPMSRRLWRSQGPVKWRSRSTRHRYVIEGSRFALIVESPAA